MNIHDIYSGTVMGSFPDDLRSGREKRRERRKKERKGKTGGERFKNTSKAILAVQINQEDQPFLERK